MSGGSRGGSRTPAHHDGRGFRNPWPNGRPQGVLGLLRWVIVERLTKGRPRDPAPSAFRRVTPAFDSPRADPRRLTATWVGHSTFLLQAGGYNVLTDPMWSDRASPVRFAGPRRRVAPGVDFDALPPVDLVLLSHDHYDHLDDATVRRIAARSPGAVWAAPLKLGAWLRRRGVRQVRELDWWGSADALAPADVRRTSMGEGAKVSAADAAGERSEAAEAGAARVGDAAPRGAPPTGTVRHLTNAPAPESRAPDPPAPGPAPELSTDPSATRVTSPTTGARVTCVPAQHFSGRSAIGRNNTLWCGWVLEAGGRRILFAGDTGHHPEFTTVAERCGPFDLVLMPVGAYEPRWFMAPVHMNPDDATTAYRELCRGQPAAPPPVFAAMHWGTFKLTDEPMDEPPRRLRAAWHSAGLDGALLWVPSPGETNALPGG